MRLIYIFDAYCIWSYTFSSVFIELFEKFKDKVEIEIVSGGMIVPTEPVPISLIASAFQEINSEVEAVLQKKFLGDDFLWHINNPELSDWFPNSIVPARAFYAFKELKFDRISEIIHDVQYGLFYEGRDLTDEQAYLHILEKYEIDPDEFYEIMNSDKAYSVVEYEFDLTKKLQVKSFPSVLLQVSLDKFFIVANGYDSFENVSHRITDLLAEINN